MSFDFNPDVSLESDDDAGSSSHAASSPATPTFGLGPELPILVADEGSLPVLPLNWNAPMANVMMWLERHIPRTMYEPDIAPESPAEWDDWTGKFGTPEDCGTQSCCVGPDPRFLEPILERCREELDDHLDAGLLPIDGLELSSLDGPELGPDGFQLTGEDWAIIHQSAMEVAGVW